MVMINGAIAPIGDLLKTEIFEMANILNEEIFCDEVIPSALIPDNSYVFEMPPSAELKNNQIDPMKWGYHDALIRLFTDYQKTNAETVVQWYKDGILCERLSITPFLFQKYGLDDPEVFFKDLEWVIISMHKAVFKRIQSPPIIILSKSSYGYDIRKACCGVLTEKYKVRKSGCWR
jgi:NAD+ synthase (glutamine-hydrolysing)